MIERNWFEGLGRRLGTVLLVILPGFFWPGPLFEPFVQSPRLVLLVLGIPTLLILRWSRRRETDPLGVFDLALSAILVFALAVSVWRTDGTFHLAGPPLAMALAALVLMEIGLLFGRFEVKGRERLLVFALASAILVAILGFSRRFLGWPDFLPDRSDVALAATLGNSNALAEFAAPLVVASLGLVTVKRRWWPLALAPLLLLGFSDSRGGQLAALIGMTVTAVLAFQSKARSARPVGLAAAAIFVTGLVAVAAIPQLRERATSVFDPSHSTNHVRMSLWSGAASLAGDNLPLGVGAGRFETSFFPYRASSEWTLSGADSRADDPHQEYLWLLAEAGIPGLVFLVVLLVLAINGVRAIRSPSHRALLAGVLTCFAVTALLRSPLHHPGGIYCAALAFGAVRARVAATRTSGWRHLIIPIIALAAGAWIALEVLSDVKLKRAQTAHESLNALASGATDRAPASKQGLLDLVSNVTTATNDALDAPIRPPHRVFRLAQIARDLARFRLAVANKKLTDVADLLPDRRLCDAVLDEVKGLSPKHPGALLTRATVELDHGHRAAAVHDLEDAIRILPNAPRFRSNLASLRLEGGEAAQALTLIKAESELYRRPPEALSVSRGRAALRLGSDSESAGFYLPASASWSPPRFDFSSNTPPPLLVTSEDSPADQRTAILIHLGRYPRDLSALSALADLCFGPLRGDQQAEDDGNLAIARTKLLYAVDALETGNEAVATINARLSRTKDSRLLDTFLVEIRLSVLKKNLDALLLALDALVVRGVPGATLRDYVRTYDKDGAVLDDSTLFEHIGRP